MRFFTGSRSGNGPAGLVLLALLSLVGCGGQPDETALQPGGTISERQQQHGEGGSPAPGTTPASPASRERPQEPRVQGLTSDRFLTPSRNIFCLLSGEDLVCEIFTGLAPEPAQDCDLDWTGISLGRTGMPYPNCAGDTNRQAAEGAPILQYGGEWKRGAISCKSEQTGLTCTNTEGHGFFLSRASWRIF